MKKILLSLTLLALNSVVGQTTERVLSLMEMNLFHENNKLVIEIKDSKPLKFQIWKDKTMILNASGQSNGIEKFPIDKGKYKIVIIDDANKSKNYSFKI